MGRDDASAVEGLGGAGIDLDVVGDAPVDEFRLRGSHPGHPVTPGDLAGGRDLRVAVHPGGKTVGEQR